MMQTMIPIPPIPHTMTSSVGLFWGLIVFVVAMFLLVTILWAVGNRRIAQKQSQIKEAERQYEASSEIQHEEQPQVPHRQEEVLLRR
jgi:F0F1-type ATP synthase membrane subunit b/b'